MLKKLITNSFSNVTIVVLDIAVVFIMTPVIVRSLGNHDYGIWEIVGSVIGYMGLLQFGIPPAIVRYVARYNALNDKEKLNQIFSSSFIIIAFTGLICALIVVAWALIYPDALAEKGMPVKKYSIFLMIVAINVLVMFPLLFLQSFYEGFQHYKLIRGITAIKMVVSSVIIYYMLQNGYGIIAFSLITTVALFIQFILLWFLLLIPQFGGFTFKKRYINKSALKELYSFGLKSFVLGIAGRISFQTDSIVIGAFLNPATVAFYIIPVNLLNKIKTMGMSITLAFMPHFSELHAKGEDKEVVDVFQLYSRYIVGIMTCMFLGVFFLGPAFIKLWIGPEYCEEGKYVLYIIGFSFLLPFLNPLRGRILTSMNKHGILAKVGMGEALLNLGLSIILVNFYGKEGVAFATLIAVVVFEPLIFYQVSKRVGFDAWLYIKEVLFLQILPVLLTALFYQSLSYYISPDRYLNIISTAIICSSLYIILFICLVMSKDERSFLFSKIKKNSFFCADK